MKIEELKEKAEKLEIEVKDDSTEEDLEKAISAKEKELEEKEKENDAEYWKSEAKKHQEEAKKAYESRDTSKQERRRLQNKIDDLEKKMGSSPDPEEVKSIKEELKDLKEFKKEVDEQREAEELKNKSEVEKAEARFNKELENIKKKMEDSEVTRRKEIEELSDKLKSKDKDIASLRSFKLENEIRDVATKLKAINPAQIVRILKGDFEYNDDLDKYEHFGKDSKSGKTIEKTVEERVTEFLEDPENDNLVRSDANSKGMETKQTLPPGKDKTLFGKSDRKALEKEADTKGISVEDLMEINKQRDEKLKKIREKKQQTRSGGETR